MIITLNQVEIETALKQYIGRQLTLADGVEMAIDLRATRGDQGQTAIITINEVAAPATPVATLPRAVTANSIAQSSAAAATVQAAAAAQAPALTQTNKSEPEPEVTNTAVAPDAPVETSNEPEPDAPAADVAESKPRSLFGKKPGDAAA